MSPVDVAPDVEANPDRDSDSASHVYNNLTEDADSSLSGVKFPSESDELLS